MEDKEKKKKDFQVSTVAEAKQKVASSGRDSGDNYVWGTRVEGSKEEFNAALNSMNDTDALIWSN